MKYMGSKRRISKNLKPIIESYIRGDTVAYIEPFVGGANMIDSIFFQRKLGYDSNKHLIILLSAVRDGWIPPTDIIKSDYDEFMKRPDNTPECAFILFCCSYGGKYRGSWASDKTNRSYSSEGAKNLLKQSESLKDISFECSDYKSINIPSGHNVIYCDPPYANTTGYKSKFNHDEFWLWALDLAEKGNTVLVSEYEAPSSIDTSILWAKEVANNLRLNVRTKSIEKMFILN